MIAKAWIAILFGIHASVFLTSSATYASDFSCKNGYARIAAASSHDQVLICEAAERTVEFLDSIGIKFLSIVQIEIVDQGRLNSPEAVGCYDWETDRVLLLPSEKCSASMEIGPYALLDADERYIGFVAHEITHALTRQAFSISDPTLTAQEYISAVVQIGVMTPNDRKQFLNQFAGNGFDTISEINLLAYLIDPAQFAAKAHRHFMKPGNGEMFVAGLLSGQFVLQDQLPY
jgi:hypothetical protein